MPNFAKLDYHAPEVTEVLVVAEGDPIPEGYIPAPDEVVAGWTYSSGHWGSPPEEAAPESTGVQTKKAAKREDKREDKRDDDDWSYKDIEDNHKKSKKDR